MARTFAIEPQGDLEGPVQFIDVYYESACAIDRLQAEDQYKVVGALCIQIGLPPPPRPKPRSARRSTGPEGKFDG